MRIFKDKDYIKWVSKYKVCAKLKYVNTNCRTFPFDQHPLRCIRTEDFILEYLYTYVNAKFIPDKDIHNRK